LSQAAQLVQVESQVIHGWLLGGQTHSATTPDGEHRICRNSILKFSSRAIRD
jgi:hypothetical protein